MPSLTRNPKLLNEHPDRAGPGTTAAVGLVAAAEHVWTNDGRVAFIPPEAGGIDQPTKFSSPKLVLEGNAAVSFGPNPLPT